MGPHTIFTRSTILRDITMELVRDHLEVVTSGPLLGNFQLGIEAKNYSLAIELLIDLYTDPIGSVVREIASNAQDANKVAGNGHIPIEVTLPTLLAPTLIIRDRGNGMSKEFLMTTYCSLLSSTKRDANEEIGGYGIGSKSPLGYTDSYTLSTRVDGEELHVHVSRNGGFYLLGSNPTHEDDGTTVIVPVRTEDCAAFARATSWLRYMDPAPLINGVPMEGEETLLQGDGWSISKTCTIGGNKVKSTKDVQVLLGPIPYSLESYRVVNKLDRGAQHVIDTPGIRLHFPIGALSLTPSRETLRYDEATIATLADTINKVYPCMRVAISKLLDSCEWMVDAVALSREYGFHYWGLSSTKPGRNYTQSSVTFPTSETWVSYTYNSWNKDHITRREITQYQFGNEVEVYIGGKDVIRRVRAYVRAKKHHSLTVIVGPADSVVEEQGILKPLPITNLPSYDNADDENDDDDKVPTPKKVLPQLSKGHMRARKWNPHNSSSNALLYAYTEDTTIPLDGEGHYLVMLRGKVIHPLLGNIMLSQSDVNTLLEGIYHNGEGDLYVVLPDQVHRLGPKWEEAIDVYLDRLSPYISWMKQVASIGYKYPYTSFVANSTAYAGTDLEGTYFCELLKLTEELSRLYSGVFSRLYRLYRYTFCDLWEKVPTLEYDPILNLRDLVGALYPQLVRGSMPRDLVDDYVRRVEADLKREWGLYSACKLTKSEPTAIMNGRKLMIHHYGGTYDVAGYYQQFEYE